MSQIVASLPLGQNATDIGTERYRRGSGVVVRPPPRERSGWILKTVEAAALPCSPRRVATFYEDIKTLAET